MDIRQLAELLQLQVPDEQICAVLSCSAEEFVAARESEECKQIQADLAIEELRAEKVRNRGWDSVEEHAVASVLTTLQANPDPEFALKAAAIANRATRRGHVGNIPIEAHAGGRTIIHLNATFADKLQQNFTLRVADKEEPAHNGKKLPEKKVNSLPLTTVRTLLGHVSQNDLAVQSIANDLTGVVAEDV